MNRITIEHPRVFHDTLLHDCHRVLLPVVSDFESPAWLEDLLCKGTLSVLLGETRNEYVSREMSVERKQSESPADFRDYIDQLSRATGVDLLVAVDQEPWGIQRLHDLVPAYPDPSKILRTQLPEIRETACAVALAAKEFGVSMFLSPVLDVLDGENPWLEGRTFDASSHAVVGSVAAEFVAGTQHAGVATVAKHFPGFPSLGTDPALDAGSVLSAGGWDARALLPFSAAIRAGTAGVMLGPAIVEDLDTAQPASTSKVVVETLRQQLGYDGLIMSDDLDAPATLNGRSLTMTMIDSLRAGADLLLVEGGEHLLESVETIYETARADQHLAVRVQAAARRVLATARTFASTPSKR